MFFEMEKIENSAVTTAREECCTFLLLEDQQKNEHFEDG